MQRLLRPKSVAVIGGGTWGEAVINTCRASGFSGPIWPVNPKRAEVAGLPAVPSLADLPDVPDAAFVAVNREATPAIVRELSAMGTGGAICFASGFAELGGADLQADLIDAAGDMPILGPNCYGLLNALDGVALWPDRHGLKPVDRGVAIVSQSGNVLLNLTMQRRGLPVAYAAAAGNQAQMGVADIGAAFLADDRVTALGLHIEGVGDLRAMEALAKAAHAAGKPVLVLKTGRSEGARAAGLSHTAALAGSAAGADALFARLGMAQVDNLESFLQGLQMLHHVGPLSQGTLSVMSCSGGEAGLSADAAAARGLDFPPLTQAQKAALGDVLGDKVALANPLDYHTYIWGDRGSLGGMITAMLSGAAELGVVILDLPLAELGGSPAWDAVVDAAAEARAKTGVPVAVLATLADTMPPEFAEKIARAGLVPLTGMEAGFDAILAATRIAAPDPQPVLRANDAAAATTWSEASAKAALASYGLDIPKGKRTTCPAEAGAAAADIGGAVVLKGEGAAHKSEAGLVALGLAGEGAVRAEAERMAATGYLVEEMVGDGIAELLIGITADPAHGFVLTIGAGGTLTEILGDAGSLLLPADPDSIDETLDALAIAPLLRGYRGKAAASRAAIHQAIAALQAFATDHAETLRELEINPLICTENRAVAADALIIMGGKP